MSDVVQCIACVDLLVVDDYVISWYVAGAWSWCDQKVTVKFHCIYVMLWASYSLVVDTQLVYGLFWAAHMHPGTSFIKLALFTCSAKY